MKTKYPVTYEGHPNQPEPGDIPVWNGLDWITVSEGSILYTHPKGFTNAPDASLAPDVVISKILVNNEGHVTGVDTRVLTPANIGAATEDHIHLLTNLEGGSNKMFWSDNSGNVQEIDQGAEGQILVSKHNAKPEWENIAAFDVFDNDNDGLVPAPRYGISPAQSTFLAHDGTWKQVGSQGVADVNLSLGTINSTSITINNDGGDGVTLPAATNSLAGLLTANAQTIGGAKTFGNDVVCNNYLTVHRHVTIGSPTHDYRNALKFRSGLTPYEISWQFVGFNDDMYFQYSSDNGVNWDTVFKVNKNGTIEAKDFKLNDSYGE